MLGEILKQHLTEMFSYCGSAVKQPRITGKLSFWENLCEIILWLISTHMGTTIPSMGF